MKIKKISFVFALIVLLLSTDLFSLISYANSEKSETVKLSVLNVKDIKNGEYTHEIDLPKDFGEFINYTFDKTGQHTATGIKSVVYNADSNKLLVTFTMGTGKVNDVNGYTNDDNGLFKANPYNAVCRYSDGARWQINEYNSDLLPSYSIVDLTRYSKGKAIPYEFVFDVFRVTGKTTLNYKNENVGHWVDAKGTTYSNDQIDNTTKTVNQNALTFPSALKASQFNFSKFTQADPSLAYNYLTANLDSVKSSDGLLAAWLRPSSAKPQSALTGHAKCQQYEYQFEYYISAKTKPVHNIEGTLTYRYKATDEAKIITTIEADPAQTKFDGKNVTVNVTLKAEVVNVKAGAVKGYKLYLRTEDNSQNPQPLGYEKDGKTLKTEVTEQFTIPASKLADKNEFREYFVGRAYAYLSTGKPNNSITSDLVKTSSLVYKNSPVVEDENHEIMAKIQGNSTVKVGDDTIFSSYGSYSTNSTIEGYRWELPNAMEQPSGSYVAGETSFKTWYNKVGTERAIVNVIDAEGRQAGAWLDFEVVEPTIEVNISQSGTRKENRKVTFNANIDTPTRYPVSKIKWKVQSLNGDLDSHIKHQANLDDLRTFDALFKKAGEYLITVDVENTAGYKNQATYVVEIVEDKKPVADFEFQQKVYRDPKNNNLATFEFTDYSYSFDGDTIAKRDWYVIFDANNDGVFDEPRVLFNTGNNTKVTHASSHVGKYRYILEVTEEFGEPTIDQYVTAADRRKTSTLE